MILYQTLKVRSQEKVCPGVMTLVLDAPDMARESMPGQFVMMKNWDGPDPFLMRPISINSYDRQAGTLTFLYKLVGRGTKLLSAARPGDEMAVIGPVGHGFPMEKTYERVAVIGRGIGIAPLRSLVEQYRAQGTEVYAYLSAKNEDFLFHRAYFTSLGAVVRCTTDPNVNITESFAKDLETLRFDAAYSCGSKRLAADMKQLHRQYGFPAYVSLEEHMACGIGACKGCVCTTYEKNGAQTYERVCKSGPVFDVERVIK